MQTSGPWVSPMKRREKRARLKDMSSKRFEDMQWAKLEQQQRERGILEVAHCANYGGCYRRHSVRAQEEQYKWMTMTLYENT